MSPHTHGAHAGRMSALLSLPASVPAWCKARRMAQQLNGMIEAGNLRSLPQHELVEMRALVMALDALADELREAEPAPDRLPPPRRWWQGGFW
jgi:hypothetical protein